MQNTVPNAKDIELEIKLSIQDIETLLNILGELPTKSGVYLLALDIKQQTEAKIAELNSQ